MAGEPNIQRDPGVSSLFVPALFIFIQKAALERQREGERRRKRNIFYALVYSPNVLNSQA